MILHGTVVARHKGRFFERVIVEVLSVYFIPSMQSFLFISSYFRNMYKKLLAKSIGDIYWHSYIVNGKKNTSG